MFKAQEKGKSNEPLKKYNDLPPLARWKALIIELGVDYDNPLLFNQFKQISLYKTKKRILRPVTENLRVFDQSKDASLIPSEIIISYKNNSSIVKLGYKPDSPILINLDKKRIILREKQTNNLIPLRVSLVRRRKYQEAKVPRQIDPSETKLINLVDVVGLDRLSVITFDGCWNWNVGKSCRFCDYNPKEKNYISVKPSTNSLSNFRGEVDPWWRSQREQYLASLKYAFEYFLSREQLKPHKHLLIMSGNLPDPVKVWEIALEIIESLNEIRKISSFDNYLNICPHPDIKYLKKAKELGVKQVQYNLEVIGEEVFSIMCPGKTKYPIFKKRLIEAVSVMGLGKVRSNFVLGIQPVGQLLRGIKRLAAKGVVADYSIFQPKRATPMADYPAPSMDLIVSFTKELVKIYKKYNFKGIYCKMSSRSSIINECIE